MIRTQVCSDLRQAVALLGRDRSEKNVDRAVAAIIQEVRQRGDAALLAYAKRFDGADLQSLAVTEAERTQAMAQVSPEALGLLRAAAERITAFHQKQRRQGFEFSTPGGSRLGQRVMPLDRVGVYIPGGTASYPSSVLMNVLPAKIAGVGTVIVATPPRPDGTVSPIILAAAQIAGADAIFKVGGAQAIAALAYGTESVPAVDKITGPGNLYVATAKRMVYGRVGIDMVAGPSEVVILADDTANPQWLAMDLLAQAEHDTMAQSVLITPSSELARAVAAQLEALLPTLPRQDIARRSIEDNGLILLTDSLASASQMVNAIAPEHLELAVDDPFELMDGIRHAGSVFLGQYAPEALGDYLAGPNHTLPTGGAARYASPLSVDDFVKRSSYICYQPGDLAQDAPRVAALARMEGLEAHARSAEIRLEGAEA